MDKDKTFDETAGWVQVSSIALLLLILLSTVVYYVVSRPDRKKDWTEEQKGTKSTSKEKTTGPLKNIWDTARESARFSSSSGKAKDSVDKPFGSSYYYAHNNPKSKGGYADGLKMEDYRMNQPRLLSRGSLSVESDTQEPVEKSGVAEKKASVSVTAPKKSVVPLNGTPITKYLWDDPGDANSGVATMRIDTLPGKAGVAISWKDANITGISTNLVDGGLVVVAQNESDRYYLHLRKLYGEVQEVKSIVKTKRLLVKFYKKKEAGKSNLEAWPRPYR